MSVFRSRIFDLPEVKHCESPIEDHFLHGLKFVEENDEELSMFSRWHYYLEQDRSFEKFLEFANKRYCERGRDSFFVAQNLQVFVRGKLYRPDFFLFLIQNDRVYGTGVASSGVFVECDGVEFHSSEEQIRRDLDREDALLETGFRTIRFSGSELCRHPIVSARRAIGQLRWRSPNIYAEQLAVL